jgi:protein pelota
MKILKKDLKTGFIDLMTESLDDLWYLSKVIDVDDTVSGRTLRLIKGKSDKIRADKGKREEMWLAVRVEKAELDRNANRLRVLGRIVEGPEDKIALGDHHTFEIDERSRIGVKKEAWGNQELHYIKDAEAAAKRTKMLICAVGDGDAVLGRVMESCVEFVNLRENLGGKYVEGREKKKDDFYNNLAIVLNDNCGEIDKIIICGCGFEKKNFFEFLKRHKLGVAKKAVMKDTNGEGKRAVYEVLKGGTADKVATENRLGKELALMDELFKEISCEGTACYGFKETKDAASRGAVSMLLISDSIFREKRAELEELIKIVKNGGGEFHILNADYDAGKRLDGIGAVAALLRYKL